MTVEEETWVDVQPLLTQAAAGLRSGELLHEDGFDLFHVMSAVEIGDPRLDAGMEQHRSGGALEEADLPTSLSGPQILAIMDQLTVMEATWHAGNPLAQTVYTSHYILRQERISHLVSLSAFCTAVKVAAQTVSDLVITAGVCDEEDFMPYMFGFQHSSGLKDIPRAVAGITLAEDRLTALQRATQPPATEHASQERACAAALLARLRFRKHYLQALQKLHSRSKQDLEAARKQLILAVAELQRVRDTTGQAEDCAEGFDPQINRRLLGPAPPRAVQLLDKDAAWAYFSSLLTQLQLVCDVSKVTKWSELKRFLSDFAAHCPTAIARSAMGLNFAAAGASTKPLGWVPSRSMLEAALSLPSNLCPEVASFMEQTVILATGWARCKCLNRARQRRRHRRSVDDWAQLFQHALNAEVAPEFQRWLAASDWRWAPSPGSRLESQGPLSVWVEKECCQELLQHLLLGFELDCYLPNEFCMLYWYCDYLYSLVVEDANSLATSLPLASANVKGKDKPAGKKPHKGSAKEAGHKDGVLSAEAVSFLQEAKVSIMERYLCLGLMRCAAALQVAGLLEPRPSLFNTEDNYFEQRFFVFTLLQAPAPLTYDVYAASMNLSDVTAAELLRTAALNFHEVRMNAQMMLQSNMQGLCPPAMEAHIHTLERIAKQNLVATALLTAAEGQRQPDEGPSQKWRIVWDFSHHKFFPVLSLKHRT